MNNIEIIGNFIKPTNIYDLIGGLSSFVVIILTAYTFYLTKISNKISLFSFGTGINTWYGYNVVMALKNDTLHDITVLEIGILYKDENDKYWKIQFSNFKENPFILKPFEIKKFESEYYQRIQISRMVKDLDLDDKNNIFYFFTGTKNIFIINGKIRNLIGKKIYNNSKYNIGTVFHNKINYKGTNINVDLGVKYIIYIKDNNSWQSFLMNFRGTTNEAINGHNGFVDLENCNSEKTVEDYFMHYLGIDKNHIYVEKISHILSNDD